MARVADGGEQLQEEREITLLENTRFGADAEDDFLFAAEGCDFGAHSSAGELQASPAEGEFGGREHGDLAVGQDRVDAGDRVGEAGERGGFVGGVDQAGVDVAAVATIDLGQGVVAFVEFEQAPLGGGGVEVGHALADEPGTAWRNKQPQAFAQELARGGMAAGFEPEDGEGQRSVDGSLSFGAVDSEHAECRLALAEQSAGVDGAEGVFQVDGGGQTRDGEAGKMAIESTAQLSFVAGASDFPGGGRTAVALTADFEFCGTRLAEALHE